MALASPTDHNRDDAGDRAYGLLSLSKKARSLTICRCHQKGGTTFSSVILRLWVLGLEPKTSHTVVQNSTNWANWSVITPINPYCDGLTLYMLSNFGAFQLEFLCITSNSYLFYSPDI